MRGIITEIITVIAKVKCLLSLYRLWKVVGRDGFEPSTNWLKGIWPFQPHQPLAAGNFTEKCRFTASSIKDLRGTFTEIWPARIASPLRSMPLWLLAWHVLIGAIWLYIFASATALSGAQSIYLDERGGALPVDQIQYSAWLVGERKGIAFRVAGATDQGCIQEGIVIRRASNEEWDGLPEQFRNAGAVSADCGEHAVVLVFHPRVKIWQGLIDHELLHAAGCWNHHFSLNDTLNASAKGPFSVTYQDANCRITADMWTIDDPDPCFAELAPDWTLYIPAIAGVRAKLLYEGVVDGGHQWGEPEVAPSIGTCVGFGVNDGTATLPNIKAYTGMVMSAQLVRTADGKWRLP